MSFIGANIFYWSPKTLFRNPKYVLMSQILNFLICINYIFYILKSDLVFFSLINWKYYKSEGKLRRKGVTIRTRNKNFPIKIMGQHVT